MKKLLIIYNIIFFFTGNILLSNIHYLTHDHHGHHDLVENEECYECINFENNKNSIVAFKEVTLSNTFEYLVSEYLDIIDFFISKECKSRAPPTPIS